MMLTSALSVITKHVMADQFELLGSGLPSPIIWPIPIYFTPEVLTLRVPMLSISLQYPQIVSFKCFEQDTQVLISLKHEC